MNLCFLSATELVALMRSGQVSAREVMHAHLAQIAQHNPAVNAVVTLVADRALAEADAADAATAEGRSLGPLHGLPVAHKDLVDTAGIRTTRGSRFYRDHVPTTDAPIVQRLRAAGAITIGKTNTPEFGAGSQTFNEVFGATRNPYALDRTCGGSSGGAAVALACGMVPIADGSDTGGSLRNPAAFCNIVGFRPSPGVVPNDTTTWSPLSVSGPMARTVADTALMLSAMAGPHSHHPLSLDLDPAQFAQSLARDMAGARIAWWGDLGGIPVEPEIRRVINAQRAVFESMGCTVDDAEPDFTGVDDAFLTLRHLSFHTNYKALVAQRPEWVKAPVQWEVAEAERLSSADVARASARQSLMFQQAATFFERFDYFVLPVTQVEPFDITVPYRTEINGIPMPTYVDWMRSTWYVSFMACPAISVPAGFTTDGLPVGLQIVGRPRGDLAVLQLAHAYEHATQHGARRPALVHG